MIALLTYEWLEQTLQSALFGIGMALSLFMLIAAVLLLVRMLPEGIRRCLSAIAAAVVFFTLMKAVTGDSFHILIDKVFFSAEYAMLFGVLMALCTTFVFGLGYALFSHGARALCEKLIYSGTELSYDANTRSNSRFLIFRNIFSVMLQ